MIAAQTHDEGQCGRGRSLKKAFQHSAGFGNDAQIPPPYLPRVPDDA